MSIVNRNVVRTILNATETTQKTNDWNANPLAFNMTTGDTFFVGWRDRFTTRHFNFVTPNTVPTSITVEFFNGTDFEPVDDLLDATNGFTQSGFVSWELESGKNWQKSNIAPIDPDKKLYWVRIKVADNLSASTSLQSILNLFTDDDYVRIYYPEFIATPDNWFPTGRTDYMDTHVGAKNLVVTRLKQMQIIIDESEIIDVNQVAIAAAHAFAVILLAPIAVSDDNRQLKDDARTDFSKELSKVNLQVDKDLDGRINEHEKQRTGARLTRRDDDFDFNRRSKLHG